MLLYEQHKRTIIARLVNTVSLTQRDINHELKTMVLSVLETRMIDLN